MSLPAVIWYNDGRQPFLYRMFTGEKIVKKIIIALLVTCGTIVNAGYYDSNGITNDGAISEGEYGLNVRVFENSILTVTGGGADEIDVKDYAHLDVVSTKTPLSGYYEGGGGVYDIITSDYSTVTFSGGIVNYIYVQKEATVLLNGGQINLIRSIQKPSVGKTVIIDCQEGWNWLYDDEQEINGITGNWHNGDAFSINFLNDTIQYKYPDTRTHVKVIPEPASLLLFGIGGLSLKKRKR